MAGFIYFTEEQKRRANEVNLESFLLRQGERLLKSGREKRLASDHSITVRGNQWYDHAIEKGGGAIDFVKMFYGKDFPDAVTMLLDGEQGSGKMVFCRIMSLDDCVKGTYGILEPKKDCQVVRADENSLILVPGCAFTRDGLRMGYGGGYYDRYLQMYKEAVTVGYAFEEQLFDAIPSEAHDRRLDFVVTQKECYEAEYSRM